jgi:arylsulfatase A-like enzyme
MLRHLLLAWGLPLVSILALGAHAAPPPMSVVFILSDDQRYDTIHALGNGEIRTPNLDRLAASGFVFNNAYCQGGMVAAVCLPSRTQIMTGKSIFRAPANKPPYNDPTLGSVFRAAGYATLYCGKRSNSFHPGNEAFEKVVYCDKGVKETPGSMGPDSPQAMQPKIVVDEALGFLKDVPAEKPVLLFLAPHYPHDPRVAPTKFMEEYDPAKLTLPPCYMPDHPFDNGALHIRDEELAPHPRTPDVMRRHLADYYACITHFDYHIGRLLDALRESGRDKNTLVLFTADQGLAVGGWHGLMGKQNLYEDFKSPLIFVGPGVPVGKSDALVYLHDLFPTLCEITGREVPKVCEGASLAAVMRGEKQRVRDALFLAYIDCQRAVRDERWKLIWYPKIDRYQLFDLQSDPYEVKDLSAEAQQAARMGEMKKLLAAQQDAFEDRAAPRPK